MIKISTARSSPLFRHGLKEYKYLSPNVYKTKNSYSLLYCNRKNRPDLASVLYREKTGQNILYGEINRASSRNLKKWQKESLSILYADALLFFRNPGFRSVALSEPKRYIHKYFWDLIYLCY